MKRQLILLAMIVLVVLLPACGSQEDPVTEACLALDQVNTALTAADLVGPATDILDIVAVQTQLTNSWRTLVSAVERLEPSQIPPSLVTANQEFQAVPVATQGTAVVVALTSLSRQATIAEGVVNEFTPVCADFTAP